MNPAIDSGKHRYVRGKSLRRSTFVRPPISAGTSRFQANGLISTAAKVCLVKVFYARMPVMTG